MSWCSPAAKWSGREPESTLGIGLPRVCWWGVIGPFGNASGQRTEGHMTKSPGLPGDQLCLSPAAVGWGFQLSLCVVCESECVQGAGDCEELAEPGRVAHFSSILRALTWKSGTHDSVTRSLHCVLFYSILLDLIDTRGPSANWQAAFSALPQVTALTLHLTSSPSNLTSHDCELGGSKFDRHL